jgi:NAD(P)-dependent dehydrogenase (short-subunit alcohol dehydrogenase family)
VCCSPTSTPTRPRRLRQRSVRARAQYCDVANGASVHAAVKACVDAFGPPDIVVNNAGTSHRNQPMLDVDEPTFDKVFAVNVKSIYYYMSPAVIPPMRQRKQGVIINIGSTAGMRPRPGLTWYKERSTCCRSRWRLNSAPTTSASTRYARSWA